MVSDALGSLPASAEGAAAGMVSAGDTMRSDADAVTRLICDRIQQAGLEPLYDGAGKVKSNVLGRSAAKNEPLFWQFAGIRDAVQRTSARPADRERVLKLIRLLAEGSEEADFRTLLGLAG